MARFALDVRSPHPPARAWAALWDLDRHTALIPLTTVTGTTDVGGRFSARTAVGPFGFDDPMEIVEWCPPARARIVKRGTVVRGSIKAHVDPDDRGVDEDARRACAEIGAR